jgi:hypothetical protein
MKTCKTCAHFNGKTIVDDNVRGECLSEDFDKHVTMMSEGLMLRYKVPDYAAIEICKSLRVNEKFGCIHHEERPQQ